MSIAARGCVSLSRYVIPPNSLPTELPVQHVSPLFDWNLLCYLGTYSISAHLACGHRVVELIPFAVNKTVLLEHCCLQPLAITAPLDGLT